MVHRAIRNLLDRSSTPSVNIASYEQVFQACHVLVSLMREGKDLYDTVRMSLEKCVGAVLQYIDDRTEEGVQWLFLFMEGWEWYERRLVNFSVIFCPQWI